MPTIKLESISASGLLVITFSEEFIVPDNLERLKAEELLIEGRKRSNLELTVAPVDGQPSESVGFSWSVVSYTVAVLTLQLVFNLPYEISQLDEKNKLSIAVWDSSLFIRKRDDVPIAPLTKLKKDLPMIVNEGIMGTIKAIGAATSSAGKGGLMIIMMGTFLLNFGMNSILAMVQNLSIITHAMMMQLMYPEATLEFYASVFNFVTFDMIPTHLIYPLVLTLANVPYSDAADKIGYESRYVIWNSGSITLYIILYSFMQLVYAGLAKVLCPGKARNFVHLKQQAFKWGGLCDFFNEVYLTMSYSVCINMSDMSIHDASEGVNNTFNAVVGTVLIVGPILIVRALNKGWSVEVPAPTDIEMSEEEEEE